MRTINGTTYTKEQLEIVRKFFTDDQWDIIDYALSEYQDHDETFELTRETQDQLGELFQALMTINNCHIMGRFIASTHYNNSITNDF